MIRITNIRRCHVSEYNEIYLIVRSIASLEKSKSSILKHASHAPELSPSSRLFYDYLNWNKANEWNQDKFDNCYKPIFLKELEHNPEADTLINHLVEKDHEGKNIALLCFCQDENLCHRSIIGNILEQKGCNVIYDRDIDNKKV